MIPFALLMHEPDHSGAPVMIKFIRQFLGVAVIFVITGCSGGGDLLTFTTEGVTAPSGKCSVDPRAFAVADALGDVGQGACIIPSAYRISEISGVKLSQAGTMNCATAGAFEHWLNATVQPAAHEIYGSRVTDVEIAATYACRPRNGKSGGKLSEHGFGNAIDVAGFTLANGEKIVVERDYYGSSFLKSVRKNACGTFNTVLGPGSDRHHNDHIHLDLANRRSGEAYCH
jgi:hypothetical protein